VTSTASSLLVFFTLFTFFTGAASAARAAENNSEDVPVAGGLAALAAIAEVNPVPDRARFVSELARVIYSAPSVGPYSNEPIRRRIDAFFAEARQQPAASSDDQDVPVPLSAELWGKAVFHRQIDRRTVVGAILTDRSAALLCYGLSGLDDETLQFFAAHPALVSRLAEHAPAAFAAFGESVRIHGGRVVPPGGDGAAALWEGLTAEKLDRPERFVQLLFETDRGRIAYLLDVLSHLDPPALQFALESAIRDPEERLNRFRRLAAVARRGFVEWDATIAPFVRPPYALAALFGRLQFDADGALAGFTTPPFWQRVFEGGSGATVQTKDAPASPDAAWVTEFALAHPVRERERRVEGLTFAQRVLGGRVENDEVMTAVRGFASYPVLMLTLERMGARNATTYVAAAQQAERLTDLDSTRGAHALAQFQGAVALLSRLVRVRTIDAAVAEGLARELFAVRLNDGRYNGAVTAWFEDRLRPLLPVPAAVPAIPAAPSLDDVILAAVSGTPGVAAATPIEWEGQRYHVDIGGAELQRLLRVRDKQKPLRFELVIGLATLARQLGETAPNVESARSGSALLVSAATELAARGRAPVDRERVIAIRDAAQMLESVKRPGETSDARKASASLTSIADVMFGEALVSLAYAGELGDPDGTILIAGDPSLRHDFGYGLPGRDSRVKAMWSIATTETRNGPSHLVGSVLALDVAMAPLALRRLNTDRVPEAPMLNLVQRDAFAITVAVMDSRALTDDARDQIAAFVDRGQLRLNALTPELANNIARELKMDGWRARALVWAAHHEPDRIGSLLTMTERLALGGGTPAAFQPWGSYAIKTRGCLCSELAAPGSWRSWWGLSQIGLPAALVADLPLQVAVLLHNLHLPAVLAKPVLAAAMQDFVDGVNPSDGNDWLTLARAAQVIDATRFEDYVAAATADGPLLPDAPER
jgi:hypothetical protein